MPAEKIEPSLDRHRRGSTCGGEGDGAHRERRVANLALPTPEHSAKVVRQPIVAVRQPVWVRHGILVQLGGLPLGIGDPLRSREGL
jgi:hypothetical protein